MKNDEMTNRLIGEVIFKNREQELRARAKASNIPVDVGQRFIQAEKLAEQRVAMTKEPSTGVAQLLERKLGNPQFALETAQEVFHIRFTHGWEASYALIYLSLMSAFKELQKFEGVVRRASDQVRAIFPDFLIVPHWRELILQTLDALDEQKKEPDPKKRVPFYQIKYVIAERRGGLSDEERLQVIKVALDEYQARKIMQDTQKIFQLGDQGVKRIHEDITKFLGYMQHIKDSGVLDLNTLDTERDVLDSQTEARVEQRAHWIEQQVERAFQRSMN